MVSSTLCPAMHILGSQNVYSRAEVIADHSWPWAVFFTLPLSFFHLLDPISPNLLSYLRLNCKNLPHTPFPFLPLFSIHITGSGEPEQEFHNCIRTPVFENVPESWSIRSSFEWR